MCMGCFFKYSKCNRAKGRISRKQKKQLVKFIQSPVFTYSKQFMYDLDSCNMQQNYKWFKPMFNHFSGFHNELILLFNQIRETYESESIYIDTKGRLCYYWETDGEYGGSSGLMPFCYSKEEAGQTWAYSEMHDLFQALYKSHLEEMPATIKSDKDLLLYIRNNPFPLKYKDDE